MSSPRFAALRIRDYRRYFLLGLLSQTADNIEHVISYWVIFQKFDSPTLGGFAVISHWVPFLLFSFYMGALADRYDCRKLIQISQGMFMLASLGWGAALPHRHAASVARGGHPARARRGRRLSTPASQLMMHDMVGGTDLPSAIRINASSRNLAILLGPGDRRRHDAAAGSGLGTAGQRGCSTGRSRSFSRASRTRVTAGPAGRRGAPAASDWRDSLRLLAR